MQWLGEVGVPPAGGIGKVACRALLPLGTGKLRWSNNRSIGRFRFPSPKDRFQPEGGGLTTCRIVCTARVRVRTRWDTSDGVQRRGRGGFRTHGFGAYGSRFAWAVLPAGAGALGERRIDRPDQGGDAPSPTRRTRPPCSSTRPARTDVHGGMLRRPRGRRRTGAPGPWKRGRAGRGCPSGASAERARGGSMRALTRLRPRCLRQRGRSGWFDCCAIRPRPGCQPTSRSYAGRVRKSA